MTRLGYHAIIAAVGIPLGLVVAMAIDRTPPYYRDRGEIMAAAPEDCGLPPNTATPNIVPGRCVYTVYYIRNVKTCDPVPGGHVSRVIEKQGAARALPKIPPTYGGDTGRALKNPLQRAWIYPEWGSDWDQPGEASYASDACYVCPFGPIANQVQKYIAPVCVDEPKIGYTVSAQ